MNLGEPLLLDLLYSSVSSVDCEDLDLLYQTLEHYITPGSRVWTSAVIKHIRAHQTYTLHSKHDTP